MHSYEVRPRRDRRGVNLISEQLPFGSLWYGGPNAIGNAVGYAKFYSRAHQTEVKVYDAAGAATEEHRWNARMAGDGIGAPK